MAIATSIIAAVALGAAVAGTAYSIYAQDKARSAANQQADAMRKSQAEQKAQMAQQAAEEKRQQVREQRVRQARILQAAENSGASYSSGEFGAIGATATNLNENLGAISGGVQRAMAISDYQQQGADASFMAQSWMNKASTGSQISGLGMTIFGAAGGFGAFNKPSFSLSNLKPLQSGTTPYKYAGQYQYSGIFQ